MHIVNTKLLVLIYLALGLVNGYYAKKLNKNPYLWFSLGVLFGIWSLITLFFLNYKSNMEKRKNIQKHLLNEIIKKQILTDSKLWYYLNSENKEIGPISSTKLNTLYNSGTISKITYIWNEELEDWKFLKDTEIFNMF